ncbi:MAG TPA: Bax inhibitor-1/YccA family protein [Candidatus Dependentiae bacterium]|nr:Bax inhibitor-1/YccA family protein [Candidatus Dependentiae bacterium]HRQ63226.1 Bax inhibitor-1/YccA family protein [Candidatus Dependentiae bacterium]
MFTGQYPPYQYEDDVRSIMYAVYGWMTTALLLTAGVAYLVAQTPTLSTLLLEHRWLMLALVIGQISLVVVLTMFLNRMSTTGALIMFFVYAALLGVTLSSIFFVYEIGSIIIAFVITAGTFGTMAVYGYFTRTDLTTMGNISLMALFGLILGLVVNFFLRSPMLDYVLSAIGVLVFTLLVAYDVQKIKQIAKKMIVNEDLSPKIAIMGALTLYLDFINLFLYLLRFFGQQKEE